MSLRSIYYVCILSTITTCTMNADIHLNYAPSQECSKTIACLEISDAIMDATAYVTTLHAISKNADALLLIVNCPGGACGASESVGRELKKIGESMPIVTLVKDQCLSGAYEVSCNSHYIVAPRSSSIGNIGALTGVKKEELSDFQRKDVDQDEKQETTVSGKVNHEIISSSETKTYRHPLSGELSEEGRQYLYAKVHALSTYFADIVAQSRNIEDNRDEWATGEEFTGQRALELGLIDEIGSYSDALNKLYAMLQDIEVNKTITSLTLTEWNVGYVTPK